MVKGPLEPVVGVGLVGERGPLAVARRPVQAAGHGASIVRLETNGTLAEAIALYRSAGYQEVEPFNDEPYAHHWFEKVLEPEE